MRQGAGSKTEEWRGFWETDQATVSRMLEAEAIMHADREEWVFQE